MFIGEAPGRQEALKGRPFVGAAGKVLDGLLESIGLNRQDVYITNIVKDRPPENRDPQDVELAACASYLERQIEAINPLIILTLGRFSMARYFQNAKISAIHGKASWVGGRLIIAMYHPAAALHQPNLKADILHDFSFMPGLIEKARGERAKILSETKSAADEFQDDAEQLSLF